MGIIATLQGFWQACIEDLEERRTIRSQYLQAKIADMLPWNAGDLHTIAFWESQVRIKMDDLGGIGIALSKVLAISTNDDILEVIEREAALRLLFQEGGWLNLLTQVNFDVSQQANLIRRQYRFPMNIEGGPAGPRAVRRLILGVCGGSVLKAPQNALTTAYRASEWLVQAGYYHLASLVANDLSSHQQHFIPIARTAGMRTAKSTQPELAAEFVKTISPRRIASTLQPEAVVWVDMTGRLHPTLFVLTIAQCHKGILFGLLDSRIWREMPYSTQAAFESQRNILEPLLGFWHS